MLFYNHKQKFIGIDEEGLKLLNFATFEELLSVCSDVADLFAKEPGYIHNFKSFGWIDFLLHADSDARSAIVQGNNRVFSCTLQVKNLFLSEEPSQNGYIVDMLHIQSINGDEVQPLSITPKAKLDSKLLMVEAPISYEKPSEILADDSRNLQNVTEYDALEKEEAPLEDPYAKFILPLNDKELQENITLEPEPNVELPSLESIRFSPSEKEFIKSHKINESYRFDPSIAAHELGLPVDLIQEFIGDFIQQSHDFKEELFEAALKGDMNNLKILSHKLKGVAANLRIEDAFETLRIINTSNDAVEIEANLKYFYTIIAKLEGKEFAETTFSQELIPPAPEEISSFADDEIYEFSLKDNGVFQTEMRDDESPPEIFFEEGINEEIQPTDPTQLLHLDKTMLAKELGIEDIFLSELILEYKQDALRSGKEIVASIAAFDTHAWKDTATKLKGISDNLRLSQISDELAILSQTNDAQEANKASKRLNSFLEQL